MEKHGNRRDVVSLRWAYFIECGAYLYLVMHLRCTIVVVSLSVAVLLASFCDDSLTQLYFAASYACELFVTLHYTWDCFQSIVFNGISFICEEDKCFSL